MVSWADAEFPELTAETVGLQTSANAHAALRSLGWTDAETVDLGSSAIREGSGGALAPYHMYAMIREPKKSEKMEAQD